MDIFIKQGNPIDDKLLKETLFLEAELPFVTSKSIYPNYETGNEFINLKTLKFNHTLNFKVIHLQSYEKFIKSINLDAQNKLLVLLQDTIDF